LLVELENLVFVLTALRDIADHTQNQRPGGGFERTQHDVDRELTAVFAFSS